MPHRLVHMASIRRQPQAKRAFGLPEKWSPCLSQEIRMLANARFPCAHWILCIGNERTFTHAPRVRC